MFAFWQRLEHDNLGHIRYIFDIFIKNCEDNYNVGYGIKILSAEDSTKFDVSIGK